MRGSRELVTVPKLARPKRMSTAFKFVWLKTLNASARSCALKRSVRDMFLNRLRSCRQNPGPITEPRAALPGATLALGTNALVLNHCVMVCAAPALGSAIWLGMEMHPETPMQPNPGQSEVERAPNGLARGVSARPEFTVVIPESSQPPATWPRSPCCALNQGSISTKSALKTCLRSSDVGPYSRLVL